MSQLDDARLERDIEHAKAEFDRWVGVDRDKAAIALQRLHELVAQRSDEQIDKMERDLGLAETDIPRKNETHQ